MHLVYPSNTIFWVVCNVIFTAACQMEPCTVRQYHFSRERDSVENHALCGYSFKNLTVSSRKNCFEHCAWDCRCISFNYLITANKDNCQLNDENRHLSPRALQRRDGYSYHEIGIDYNVKAGTKCTHCYNACCLGNDLCRNGGTCQEICEANNRRFACKCRPGYAGRFCDKALAHPRSCTEVKKRGGSTDGVYMIDPDGMGAFEIFCKLKNVGKAWAVIQRRLDESIDFYRGWEDYKRGFGHLNGTFWLGLEKIHRLTSQKNQNKLRVELENFFGSSCYAEYDNFSVNGEDDKYKLERLGSYQGTGACVDSLNYNREATFSTKDNDTDSLSPGNCAVNHRGAWWYKSCTQTNLNGLYRPIADNDVTGIYWYQTQDKKIVHLKRVEMMLELVE